MHTLGGVRVGIHYSITVFVAFVDYEDFEAFEALKTLETLEALRLWGLYRSEGFRCFYTL